MYLNGLAIVRPESTGAAFFVDASAGCEKKGGAGPFGHAPHLDSL
jgi:hypothetical protein